MEMRQQKLERLLWSISLLPSSPSHEHLPSLLLRVPRTSMLELHGQIMWMEAEILSPESMDLLDHLPSRDLSIPIPSEPTLSPTRK